MLLIGTIIAAKTVFVREYLRLRLGKVERVRSHLRRPPQ